MHGDEDPQAELVRRLRMLRAELRVQVGGLVARTGLSRTTVSQVLNGHKLPTEDTLTVLAKALRVPDPEPLLELRRRAAAPVAPRKPTFESRYLAYVAEKHSQLTVVGLDLSRQEQARWPVDAAYLSLELAEQRTGWPADETPQVVVKRAESALADHPRVLLRGLAGSGKTTLLQWLAVGRSDKIPFVLPLRTLARRGPLPEPCEFLKSVNCPLAGAQPDRWADGVLAAGRAIVLVDGVDEVAQEHRAATRDWLEDLLAAYPDAHFVITTRPSAVPEGWLAGERITELTVRPMSAADIEVFIGRWHDAARCSVTNEAERDRLRELATDLCVTVRAQRDLAQLSRTPLMCALICALHRDRRGHLPYSRMELYEAALSMLLVRRDRERDVDSPEGIRLTEHQSVQLLQRLAYWLVRNRQTEMEEVTALALMADALPAMPTVAEQGDAERVLAHLVGRTGLLRQPTDDTLDFVHRTFQDYLGAKAAVEARDIPLLINNAHDDQWEDVIRMAVAHGRPPESADILRRLVKRGETEPEHGSRIFLLAAASLRFATEVEPATRGLVEDRARDLVPPRSYAEAHALADLGPGILDLLPGPEQLDDNELNSVVTAAGAVQGEHAYAFLRRFAHSLPPGRMAHTLADVWLRFDADTYAREVLLALRDRNELSLIVQDNDQRNALRLLKPVTGVSFRNAAFRGEEIVEHLSPEFTRRLRIHSGELLTDLTFIRGLTALEELSLSRVPRLTHLRDLAGLSLSQLSLMGLADEFDLSGLSHLPKLVDLSLQADLPQGALAELPVSEGLTTLSLGGRAGAQLTGVSRFQQLQRLMISSAAPDEAEWREIASLQHLMVLCLLDDDLADAVPVPEVKHLQLIPRFRTFSNLDLIPELFPRLEHLSLGGTGAVEVAVDLTPVSGIQGLQVTISWAGTVTGLEHFPRGAVTLYPRPRATVGRS